jgi:hypothetical protein
MAETIKVIDAIGSEVAVSSDDGEKLYELANAALEKGDAVVLDFEGVETLITAFLNAGVGQLYKRDDRASLDERLEYRGLDEDDEEIIERVVEAAKRYYADPERFLEERKRGLEDG